MPDPITTNPGDPNSDETLLGVLQRLKDLSAQPLVPNNPMAQLGVMLQGFSAGTQGKANPALEMYAGQRAQALKGLGEEGTIGAALATVSNRRAQRGMELDKLKV